MELRDYAERLRASGGILPEQDALRLAARLDELDAPEQEEAVESEPFEPAFSALPDPVYEEGTDSVPADAGVTDSHTLPPRGRFSGDPSPEE